MASKGEFREKTTAEYKQDKRSSHIFWNASAWSPRLWGKYSVDCLDRQKWNYFESHYITLKNISHFKHGGGSVMVPRSHKFCSLLKSIHQFLSWSSSTLRLSSKTKIRNTAGSPPLDGSEKQNEGIRVAESKSRLTQPRCQDALVWL